MRVLLSAVVAATTLAGAAQAGSEFRLSTGTSTRASGSDQAFGATIGVDVAGGSLRAAWADNSASTSLELFTAAADAAGTPVAPNVDVSGLLGDQAGASVAVNPLDTENVVAVSNTPFDSANGGLLTAVSRNGGVTWSTRTEPLGFLGIGAPAVAFDPHGNLFLAYSDGSVPFQPKLALRLSTDGGATFRELALPPIAGFEVRPSLAADGSSVRIAFVHVTSFNVVAVASASVAGLGAVGSFTVADLPGSLNASNPDLGLAGGRSLVVAERLFGDPPTVDAWIDGAGPVQVTNVRGYPEESTPSAAVDASGRLYVAYADPRFGRQSEDVRLRFSDDGGATWSAAQAVNGDADSVDRLLPTLDSGPDGLGVGWYDFRSGGAQLWARVLETVETPPEPASPLNLRAVGVSRSQIDLTWLDRSGNEAGFEIRRVSGSPFAPVVRIFTVGAGVTSFSETGLPEDTGFSYVVRAFNAAGFSTPANPAAATTLDTAPTAPSGLTATALSFQRIDLAWQPSDDADGYEIQQSTDGATWTSLGRGGTGTNAMLFGLQSSTTYFFRVRGFNSGGDSPFSNVASATTFGFAPGAPVGLTATTVSRSQIDLRWIEGSGNESRFEIERATDGRHFRLVGSVGANVTTFSSTRLKAGQTYTFRVRACNEHGCSPPSNDASATTPR
jgi:hypothetical protein